jgi:TolB-like protein
VNAYNKSLVFFIGALAVLAGLFLPGISYAKVSRVAIVPFKINAEKDLSFLRDGIVDMLSSRLSWEGKVEVVSKEDMQKVAPSGSLSEAAAREIGKKVNADYVLFGSLTVFGESVSIDAKMADVTAAKPTLAFFNQAKNLGEVIPKINQFAADINEKIFGRALPVAQRPVTPSSVSQGQQPVAESRMNPEKLWHGDGAVSDEGVTSDALNPAFISTRSKEAANQNIYKSRSFNELINGLALGDVDGDGKVEAVMVTPDKVLIYRYDNQRFIKVQELENVRQNTHIAVDVADINGNGKPEIFVTTLGAQKNTLDSYVLEFDGKQYVRIVNKSPWYYRVVQVKGKGAVLLGQKQVMANDPFQEPIYEMKWIGGEYAPQDQVLPGGVANALGVAIGNIRNANGPEDVIHFTRSDLLQLTTHSGDSLWTASERAGGTMSFLQMPVSDPGVPGKSAYFPMRILIADLGTKGKTDVIAVSNSEMGAFLLQSFRNFTSCHVASYSWDGVGLAGNWKTRKISGRIADFTIGDFYNNGKLALVAALVTREGALIGMEPQSAVIAWELSK